jgi:SAM-dependent methyltransferase
MSVFGHYARYYDLLYRDKDYAGESAFVGERLRKAGCAGSTMMELGCGTGKHAVEFARLGWVVTGYDLSEQMVEQARERAGLLAPETARKLNFAVGDVRRIRDGQTYDAVISLFHVMSYQTTNADLQAAFATAAVHLKPGGLFFFDFWYGPAVLSDPPVVRVKRLEDERIQVTRLAEPECDVNNNKVTVNYHCFVKDKETGQHDEIRESHPMRYLFLPELDSLSRQHGLEICGSGKWLSDGPLSMNTWYGWVLAKKSPPE